MDQTTRNFSQWNLDILRGAAGGRILWQPRIGEWYDARIAQGIPFPDEFQGLTLNQIYRKLGCSARTYLYQSCLRPRYDRRVQVKTQELSPLEYQETFCTPAGNLTQIIRRSSTGVGEYPRKWLVETPEDLRVDSWLLAHTDWEFDRERFAVIYQEWGDLGATCTTVPHLSIQRLTQDTMGLENAVYALNDEPELVKENLRCAHDCHHRLAEVLADSPLEIINFGGHGDSRLLPPEYMERFLLAECQSWNDLLHSHGKFTYSHWDGAVKPLLRYVKELGFDAIEAITPLPQGDVSLREIKQALGDHTVLVDGIAALLFDPCYPEEQLIQQVQEALDLFAPRLILGISDEIAYTGDLGRIRLVQRLVDTYNSRLSQISKTR